MSGETPRFRNLYNEVINYRGDALFESILLPWLDRAVAAATDFACFRLASKYDQQGEEFQLKTWNLYALSRVNDFLLLSFQSDESGVWTGPHVSNKQYVEFFERARFASFTCDEFSPFHHEVVEVEQSEDRQEPISVCRSVWPGLTFGEMIFSRSGVVVKGGSAYINKHIAESSTLYFSHRRLHRKTDDLSIGWGSNSQWRTNFRRDYSTDGRNIFNIDGKNCLSVCDTAVDDRDGLTNCDRIELCRNRCFIVSPKISNDLWPYDDRLDD